MIKTMLANMAIILFMHRCVQHLYLTYGQKKKRTAILHVIIVSLTVIALFYFPILIENRFRFDLRAIPISFIGILHGPLYVIPVVIISAIGRLSLGGLGALPGVIFGITVPAVISLIIRYCVNWKKINYGKGLLYSTIIWAACDLPFLFYVHLDAEFYLLRYITFQISMLILFSFTKLSFQHNQLLSRFKFFADHDPLTKLYNMKRFNEEIMKTKQTENNKAFIAMLDIDHFKRINDTFGHQAGDQVLIDFAQTLLKFHRKGSIIARYGGEEFIAYKLAPTIEDAASSLDELRKYVEAQQFYTESGDPLSKITISIGIAPLFPDSKLEQAVKIAGGHLYKAKENGRNRVVF
ncbi:MULTISPECIES: diguanylate cyclase [Heyndrickxia]|uniref:Diguanylate cyclase n=2 Tax=Heyndrickxia sporothermodurans TaxID=46224 RepID=A0AB37HBH7_9BACI|nr:diguanylate cyclase [Heyndrickxia sporothermodurans]MBL5767683.1 diguanylate cyclase [Heyndrickxia sporothermodurans]MBL5774847.1 diguanylate cyclase [Heyndrickxia sporothermodurans]MBL5778572.1 diguanylate cyclase [Heyndrickxia sporothermodurans]MBL5785552.1 diguanylate cyclase [Heyndrickxia sporothermodurans]MBL5789111.1 diguanylate cyclase [Heyndrickxia sporothermodurans]